MGAVTSQSVHLQKGYRTREHPSIQLFSVACNNTVHMANVCFTADHVQLSVDGKGRARVDYPLLNRLQMALFSRWDNIFKVKWVSKYTAVNISACPLQSPGFSPDGGTTALRRYTASSALYSFSMLAAL